MSLRHFANSGRCLIDVLKTIKLYLKNGSSVSCYLPRERSHGVMVSTLDSESSDPSSNLGGTYNIFFFVNIELLFCCLRKVN